MSHVEACARTRHRFDDVSLMPSVPIDRHDGFSHHIAMTVRSRIAITPNRQPPGERASYRGKTLEFVDKAMADAIWKAGGIPVMLPSPPETLAHEAFDVTDVLEGIAGLVLAGGDDVSSESYGQSREASGLGDVWRDRWELALYTHALNQDLAVLGVCRGVQLLNVAHGGTLWQDLPSLRALDVDHRDDATYDRNQHVVVLESDTLLRTVMGCDTMTVNSIHHQGVDAVGDGLVPIAWSSDGLVEAMAHESARWVLGVQWHPEWMGQSAEQRGLFEAFVAAAGLSNGGRGC